MSVGGYDVTMSGRDFRKYNYFFIYDKPFRFVLRYTYPFYWVNKVTERLLPVSLLSLFRDFLGSPVPVKVPEHLPSTKENKGQYLCQTQGSHLAR